MTEALNQSLYLEEVEISGTYHADMDAEAGYHPVKYYFKPKYFNENNGFNPSLASMSLVLAMAGFSYFPPRDKNELKYQDSNIKYLLTGNPTDPQYSRYDKELTPLGFKAYSAGEYYGKEAVAHSIAFSFSHKEIIQNTILISVCIRGGGYRKEWGGNVTVFPDTNKHHMGFDISSDTVMYKLEDYIIKYKEVLTNKTLKLWIVGYSRGAATANLAAAKIINKIESGEGGVFKSYVKNIKNIFAYTFETPAGVLQTHSPSPDDSRYNVIHNIINSNDFVTKVAPVKWEYTRFGEDYALPYCNDNNYEDKLKRMLKCMKEHLKIENPQKFYIVDSFRDLQGNHMSEFFDKFFEGLFSKVFKPSQYHNAYQSHFHWLMEFLNDPKNEKAITELFTKQYGMQLLNLLASEKAEDVFVVKATDIIFPILKRNNIRFNNNTVRTVLRAVHKSYMNFSSDFMMCLLGSQYIVQGHFTVVCMAWLMSLDRDNYRLSDDKATDKSLTAEEFFTNGTYRTIYIKAPVNITVTDGTDKKVIEFINGEFTPNLNDIVFDGHSYKGSTSCGIDQDDQVVLSLPTNGAYTVTMEATGSGSLDYTVTEYSPLIYGMLNVSSYHSPVAEPISAGDVYVSHFGKKTGLEAELDCTISKVTASNESELKMTEIMSLANKADPYVDVTVKDIGAGISIGRQPRILGTQAKLTAKPQDGGRFIGWYGENDNLLSSEIEYTLRADKNIEITAKYSEIL